MIEPYKCMTGHPVFFYMCLYPSAIRNQSKIFNIQGYDTRGKNEKLRCHYTAYRSYTAWIHGKLGFQNRKEIPQCVTKAIRKAFPAPDGAEHIGFQDLDL
jgi:hypothetical protein